LGGSGTPLGTGLERHKRITTVNGTYSILKGSGSGWDRDRVQYAVKSELAHFISAAMAQAWAGQLEREKSANST